MTVRAAPGGYIFHVVNRAISGLQIFDQADDYLAFELVMAEACCRIPMRVLAYCLMPNHWHLVLWPLLDGDLGKYMHWLTLTHVRRWRQYRETVGRGHVYQGTYKSFPIENDRPLLIVCRYVERNAQT
jgi:putative transposase